MGVKLRDTAKRWHGERWLACLLCASVLRAHARGSPRSGASFPYPSHVAAVGRGQGRARAKTRPPCRDRVPAMCPPAD